MSLSTWYVQKYPTYYAHYGKFAYSQLANWDENKPEGLVASRDSQKLPQNCV